MLFERFCILTVCAVVVVLCFGDADGATIGLMIMCGFVCATGAVASTGGRTLDSLRFVSTHIEYR